MTLDSESKKRLIEQTRMVRTRKRCKPRPGDSDAVSRGEREDVIKQGEQLYRAIFDGSRDAIFITAPDAGFVEVNEAASVLTGYSPEELKNMTIPDLHEEEDMEAYRQFFRRIMAGEQITCEARILRKDGIKVDTEFSNRKIMLGDAVYMHTVARDITERKQAEEALRISEAKYQDLYDQAPDMFVSVDAATGNILDCNQTTATKLGYKKEEIIGRHISEMYHPDSEEDRKKVFKTFAEAGEVHDAELQLKRKDGSRLDVSLNVSAVRDDQGKILYSRSIWRDISMRKQAEAALRQSEEKYHLLVENAPSVLWKTSEKGITVFISSNIEEVYGYTPEEIYADGYNSWFGRIRREDLQEVEKSFQALFGKGKKFDVEYRIKRKDGEWIWVHDAASVVHEENGERYAYGVFTDITERKQVEEELRASEEKYKSIFETAPASLVMVDKNGKIVDINPHHLANIAKGKTPKEYFIGKSIIKHPSIVNAGLSEEYGKVLEGEELDKKDVYFPTLTSGMDGYFNVKGVPVVKADEVIGAVFTHEDITERKRAEDELKSLSSVVEQSTEGMAIADLNGNLIFVNKAWCKMHGYKSYESLVGKYL